MAIGLASLRLASARPILPLLVASLGTGCTGAPSPLDPRSAGAARIAELGWIMIALAAAVCVIVFAALSAALWLGRRHPAPTHGVESPGDPGALGPNAVVVVGGMLLPALVIAFTLGATIHTLRQLEAHGLPAASSHAHADSTDLEADLRGGAPFPVQVVGKQWWWRVNYPTERFTTANEIHVPAGSTIQLSLTSDDVIHSFWVPQLAGKVDMIPGKTNVLSFRVDAPGVYRGLCSEYCGLQHAHMHFRLIVDAPDDFARWLDAQRRDSAAATDALAQAGQEVFARSSCGQCHTVRGTAANGIRGPDLTHVAGRGTLGAGTHANTRANLAGWTADAQGMKPGNGMPNVDFEESDLQAIVAYLETLK